ncbi:ZIP family metal transporter [Comamonas nitrativorans]|uniref:ZIP family metal transporter n=1 Tax=Comamonas nitrativorans TaxID=108437 RepID=A0ABV9GW94_9BURK
MVLIAIILATLAAGIGSVWVANALLHVGFGRASAGRAQQGLLSLAAGALLATAFMHLLPEAFESGADAQQLFTTLLIGIVFFFLLTKAELWHHGHEHSHDPQVQNLHHAHHGHDHDHAHGHTHTHRTGSGWSLLTGDSVHCFGDGVLIASAFLADLRLGLIAAVSVLAHEVPHHMGDLVVMSRGSHRRVAMLKVSLAGSITALGGLAGYFLVGQLHDWLPFFLTVACSSFIYVALSDLIPQLQKHLSARQTLAQVLWLALGIGLVTVVSGLAHDLAHESHGADASHAHHAHDHDHDHDHEAPPLSPHHDEPTDSHRAD